MEAILQSGVRYSNPSGFGAQLLSCRVLSQLLLRGSSPVACAAWEVQRDSIRERRFLSTEASSFSLGGFSMKTDPRCWIRSVSALIYGACPSPRSITKAPQEQSGATDGWSEATDGWSGRADRAVAS